MKQQTKRSARRLFGSGFVALAVGSLTMAFGAAPAGAIPVAPAMGIAASYSVAGATTVTNTGNSVLSGSVNVYAGTAITGVPPGINAGETVNSGGTAVVAGQVAAAALTAYGQATAASTTVVDNSDLGGQNLTSGVYTASSSMQLTGTLTLTGDASSVFIFQAVSGLNTAVGAHVVLSGPVDPCNVFWQVGSTATIGGSTAFVGTILASTSVSLGTGASLQGRAMANTGAVTLDNNAITSSCTTSTPTTTSVTSTTVPATTTTSTTTTTTVPATTTTVPQTTTTGTPIVKPPKTGGGPLGPNVNGSPLPWLGLLGLLLGGGLVTAAGFRWNRDRHS